MKEAIEMAKEDSFIREKRLKIKTANTSNNHGLIFEHEKGNSSAIINQSSIRYVAAEIPFIASYSLQELFNKFKEIRWRMSKNDVVDFISAMAVVQYELSPEDQTLIKSRFSDSLAGIETRISFDNDRGLHFLVAFSIQGNGVTIQIDANSKDTKKQEEIDIDAIIQDIGCFAMNPQDLFEKIQLPIGKDLPRSLDYIIARNVKKYEKE